MYAELAPEDPSDLETAPIESGPTESGPTETAPTELEEPSDLDFDDVPCTDDDDESRWEAFIPDEDEWDPAPDPGDFWIESRTNPCFDV
jgi:hypothetical protein